MKIVAKNKSLGSYDIEKEYDAGIVLEGHEVKSIKLQGIKITEGSIRLIDSTLFLTGCEVSLYKSTSPNLVHNYDSKRHRTLLLNKREIAKIYGLTHKTGRVIVPMSVFLSKGLIKIHFGVGSALKKFEKKSLLKEKDQNRQMQREVKEYR